MDLIVEDLGSDATKIGLAEESVQAAAESRLRSARLYSEVSEQYLYVNVNVVGSAFRVGLQYNKQLLDPLSRLRRRTSTWETGATGTHGRDAGYILSAVSEQLDRDS